MYPDYNDPAVATAYFMGERHAAAGYVHPCPYEYRDEERQLAYERGLSDRRSTS